MLARKKLAALARKKRAAEFAKNPPPKPEKKLKAKSLARKLSEKGPLKPLAKTYSHRDSKVEITRPDKVLDKNITPKNFPLMYSGDRLLGIAVQHKSCLVPVFSQEEAESIAKMRRN